MIGHRRSVEAFLYRLVVVVVLTKAAPFPEVSSENVNDYNILSSDELEQPLHLHPSDSFDSMNLDEFNSRSTVLRQQPSFTKGDMVSEALDSWLQHAMEKKGTDSLAEISAEVLELARSIAASSDYQVEVNLQVVMEGGRTTIHENLSTLFPGHKNCWIRKLRAITFCVSAILVVGCVVALLVLRQSNQNRSTGQASQEELSSSTIVIDFEEGCWHKKRRSQTDQSTPLLPKTSL